MEISNPQPQPVESLTTDTHSTNNVSEKNKIWIQSLVIILLSIPIGIIVFFNTVMTAANVDRSAGIPLWLQLPILVPIGLCVMGVVAAISADSNPKLAYRLLKISSVIIIMLITLPAVLVILGMFYGL